MNKVLKEKIMEAFGSVLPITAIVLIASVVLVSIPAGTVLLFLGGAGLLVVGMGFFTLGADMAMIPMGEGIGAQLTRSTSIVIALVVSFVMGVIITVAEPDLRVLAQQAPSVEDRTLIFTVAGGVGFFLVVSVLRIFLKIRLGALLIFFYVIVFGAAYFTPGSFIPVAFDSGGVTTGPITVPFILAMGVGVASLRGDKNSQDDSFGLVALCSIGPILTVLVLGMLSPPGEGGVMGFVLPHVETSRDVVRSFALELPHYSKDVLAAMGAIVFFFALFQIVFRRYKRHQLGRIMIGFGYTFIGLVLFLTGVNIGFIPVGHLLGSLLGASEFKWALLPLGVLIGYYIVKAEPAVHVLNKQVEEITSGAIPQKMMNQGLSLGMSAALAITMLRILLGIPLMYILVPGYAFALVLTFFVPRMFTGIAFDSGGVCSGPMTSTFLLPLAMGTCEGVGGELMTDAFGIVAMVAMTPLIVIQMMGLLYLHRTRRAASLAEAEVAAGAGEGGVLDYGEITLFDEEFF
ncbi:MAG: DUF1538 domain-containing protein [Spirochaetales bacterium]|jgi:hypothetical protein|nr:DUF1538 domain-containing protein [Spirochaetales bacterium]